MEGLLTSSIWSPKEGAAGCLMLDISGWRPSRCTWQMSNTLQDQDDDAVPSTTMKSFYEHWKPLCSGSHLKPNSMPALLRWLRRGLPKTNYFLVSWRYLEYMPKLYVKTLEENTQPSTHAHGRWRPACARVSNDIQPPQSRRLRNIRLE
jgi:hypothetical protein